MQKFFLAFGTVLLLTNGALAQVDAASQPSDTSATDHSFILTDPNEVLKHDDERVTISLRNPKRITILGDCPAGSKQ